MKKQWPSLDDLCNDGYSNDHEFERPEISLKIALRAYFSTYQSVRHALLSSSDEMSYREYLHEEFDGSFEKACEAMDRSFRGYGYHENYFECIVHFQHFSELICKYILRQEHPLLADEAPRSPVVLLKLLKGEPLTDLESAQQKSIAFSETLSRLDALIKKRADSDTLTFINKHMGTLKKLNDLRNRAWHRGIFVLKYEALDQFICHYVLEFIFDVTKYLESCGKMPFEQAFPILHCNINPAKKLQQCARYDKRKYALLKELGRAALTNPFPIVDSEKLKKNVLGKLQFDLDDIGIKEAQKRAKAIAGLGFSMVSLCPVCGREALIKYIDIDLDHNGDSGESAPALNQYIYSVRCEICTFEPPSIVCPKEHGFNDLEDYWSLEN